MAQTSYSGTPAPAIPGGLGNVGPKYVSTRNNENASALPFGVFVKRGAAAGGADALSLATDDVIGISVKSDAHPITSDLTGNGSISTVTDFDCLEEGAAWVRADAGSVPGPGDDVFVRFATGTGTVIGAVRKTHDSATCRLLKGARAIKTGTAPDGSSMSLIVFSRAVEATKHDRVVIPFSNAALTNANATYKLTKTPADRFFVVDEVYYDNPTGLAQDTTNVYTLAIKGGSQSAAKWDTTTGVEGTIAADTLVQFTNDTLAHRLIPPATEIDFTATKGGTQNLPAGSGMLVGHFI